MELIGKMEKEDRDFEYDRLVNELRDFTTHRNNLLVFSFTVVLSVLGVVAANWGSVPAYLCLVPLFLTVPFAARVSYYRIAAAHRTAFLEVFYPERQRFTQGVRQVKEGEGATFRVVSFLVNTEMLVLSCVCVFFYVAMKASLGQTIVGSATDAAVLAFGGVMIAIAGVVTCRGYRYRALKDKFAEQWRKESLNESGCRGEGSELRGSAVPGRAARRSRVSDGGVR